MTVQLRAGGRPRPLDGKASKQRRRVCAASIGKRPHAAARTKRGAPAPRPEQPKSTGLRGRTGPGVRPETGREARTQAGAPAGPRSSAAPRQVLRRRSASIAPHRQGPAPLAAPGDRYRQAETRDGARWRRRSRAIERGRANARGAQHTTRQNGARSAGISGRKIGRAFSLSEVKSWCAAARRYSARAGFLNRRTRHVAI